MAQIFTLSIEIESLTATPHPYHLGTDKRVARTIAEEVFRARDAKSVALIRGGVINAVFDGEWSDYSPMHKA